MHTQIYLGEQLLLEVDYAIPVIEGRTVLIDNKTYTVLDVVLNLNGHAMRHRQVVHVYDANEQLKADMAENESILPGRPEKGWSEPFNVISYQSYPPEKFEPSLS